MERLSDPPATAPTTSSPASAGHIDPGILHAHLAEYNALTTRLTYWLTLQFAVWPIIMGFWGLLALLWGKLPDSLLLWGGACLSQAFGLMWYGVTIEIYRAARYIDRDLKPRVEAALGGRPTFWTYEYRNREDRGELLLLVWEWPVALGALIVVGGVSILRFKDWGTSDYLAGALNGALSLGMIAAATAAGRIRQEITAPKEVVLTPKDAVEQTAGERGEPAAANRER